MSRNHIMTGLENMTTEELKALLKKREAEEIVEPEPVPESEETIVLDPIEDEPALKVEGDIVVDPLPILEPEITIDPIVVEVVDDVVVEEPLPTPEPPMTIQADIGEIIEEMEPEEEIIIIEYNPQKALELLKQSDAAFGEFVKTMGLQTDGIRMNWEAGHSPLKEAILYLDPPEE